jgi:PKD repeat protein
MRRKSLFRTVLVIFVLVLIIPTFVFSANEKPKEKKGAIKITVNGTLVHWKNLKKIDFSQISTKRKMKPIMNFQNPRTIKRQSTEADPAVQGPDTKGLMKGALMPATSSDFAGMSLSANGAGWPPDTCGDVGPNYYVQCVNTSIAIYNKSTGNLVSATTFDAFFGGTGISGTPCDNDNNGDPIVLYDQYNQRWFILDFAWTGTSNGSWYSIAASKTSDPTGEWWQYAYHADNTLMNDYPKSGVWHDGIYTTANMFNFSTSQFQHVKVWAFKTPDIYTGTLTVQSLTDSSAQAWSLLPTNAKGSTASTGPNYMYALDADEYGGSSIDAIYGWKYDVDWNNSANTTWTGPTTMATVAYGLTASGIPQSGTSVTLDSLYGRLMYPANYRNFGSHASVYVSHVAESGGKRVMRWYEIRINSGNSSIYQQGTYDPDSNHRWMGSVMGDKYGNIAMGYSVSSTAMKPAIRYAGRLSTDTLGTMGQGEASIIEGTGHQTSYTRWGDYSHLTIDPDDDETFWYTTEYYAASGTNWQTRIGSFKFSTTPFPPVANFSGSPTTVTEGGSVDFTDLSTNSPTSWSWTFTGGTPSSSTAQNPAVTYNTAGTYTVTLTATNAGGSDGETKTNYITVNEPGTGFCDDFSDGDASDWTPSGGTWAVVGGQLDGIDSSNLRTNIAPAGDVGAGTISVDWTSLTGGTWTNGMVVFGYQDARNYRVIDCRDGSNTWFIKEYVGGTVSTKAQLAETINTNQQYHLVVTIAESGVVTLTVDGTQKVSYDFGNVITGKVGVALQNSHSQFDNFCVDDNTVPPNEVCDNFNDGDASDWTYYGSGTWSASANQLEGSHPSTFTYAISPVENMTDGTISADFTSHTGGTWTNGQIVFGWQDANNHYLADCRVGGNKWRIRQRVNGTLSNLSTTSETINSNQLYQLELVIASDGNVTLFVDGVAKVTYDFGSVMSGKTGVSVEKAVSVFDNFCVAAGQ